jgi:putative transposase
MSHAVPFLAFDTEIRSIICATNAIESLNARVPSLGQGPAATFPIEEAALKHLYLVIISLDPAGPGVVQPAERPS